MRTIDRLGFRARQANGRMGLHPAQVARLRAELGVSVQIPGLTPTEVRALAALRGAPLGLASARAVARRAAISPTAASRALRALDARELVRREPTVIAAGHARPVEIFHANRRSPRWAELAPMLAHVQPPANAGAWRRDAQVPKRLWHLFWNTSPSQLDVGHGGPYIARRLLSTMDLDGLAWGARNLRASDWERARQARGLDTKARSLARNLAAQSTA
jgi:hypothetical protein